MPAVVNISASTTVEARGRALPQLPPGTPFEDLFEEFFNRRGQGGQGGPGGQGDSPRQRRSNSLGSGFVIDPSGIVVTNNHVIGDANEINVIFSDGQRLNAEIIGKDTKTDLALLVNPEKPLKAVPFGDSDKMRPGTGSSPSAIRSGSADRSRPASSRRAAARSGPAPTTTSSRPTPRSTPATPAGRCSTSTAR